MRSEPIKVVLVDDHEMFRDSLAMAIERVDDLVVVGTAGSVAEARSRFADASVDVVLLDYSLPDATGVELAAELHELDDPPRTLILTASEGAQAAAEAVAAGCTGFMRKSASVDQLVRAVRRAEAGEALFDTQTLSAAITWLNRSEPAPEVELTERELEVMGLLGQGRSTGEISEQLFLSLHTVRNHIRNALTKLDARSQLEGVVIATSLGLIEVGRPGLSEED